MMIESAFRYFGVAVCALLISGCAATRYHSEGLSLMDEGRYEEAILKLEEAVKAEPDNLDFKLDLTNKRHEIARRLLSAAESKRTGGDLDGAEGVYRRVLVVDKNNEQARNGLELVDRDRRQRELISQATVLFKKGEFEEALEKLQPAISMNPAQPELLSLKRSIEAQLARSASSAPTLNSIYRKPVSFELKDANVRMVFDVLSRTTGINFILDSEVRSDMRTTLSMKQTTLEDVVDYVLATNQLEKKVLNQNSVLIYPDTPTKVKSYQDLMVKTFYLANADVKQTMNMVKTLLKTRDIYVDEKLNMMIMRDTPETIHLAEKLIAMQDIAEPEVMLEIEVLEVKRSKLTDLGINYPSQVTLSALAAAGGGSLTLNKLKNINDSSIGASMSNMTINLKQVDGLVNILANPRIRARNREKAKIMIGDRVPVVTTTGSLGFVSENINYVDVGLKVEVEPNVHLYGDVSIRIGLEVSSIVQQIKTSSGSQAYQIGNRSASTLLQLKDGETQVLAGLISNEERGTANKIPGLGDLPVAGRLFGEHIDDKQKTEIVLSITPRIVRNLKRLDAPDEEFWSGTEDNLRTKALTLQPVKVAAGESKSAAQVAEQPVKKIETGVELAWQGPAQVKVGEEFTVALRAKSNEGLRSLLFQLGYDSAAFEVVEVSEGGLFKLGDASTNFTNNIDAANGKISGGVARSDADDGGVKGEESVVLVKFKARASAQGSVRLLAATPVGTGDAMPRLALPTVYQVAVVN
jgi:general secretion pathway protein D